MLTGADLHLLKCLKLQRNVDNYAFLHNENGPATQTRGDAQGTDDKTHFLYTKTALEVLGFSGDEIVDVFRVIAVVLKLGNIKFVPSNNIDGTEGSAISNDYELYDICELLGVEQKWLYRALTSRNIDDVIIADLSAGEASRIRNSLCKTLYSRLFTWLINRINDSTKSKQHGKRKVLGVLDMYGFEVFERNYFEQLVINYCNEKIHQTVIQITLKDEQEDYIKEGIEWTRIEFFNNSVVCDLIEQESHGILTVLDEPHVQCDAAFLTRVEQCWAGHSHCLAADPSLSPNSFQIRHYAGPVTYSVEGFVDKNHDILHRELSRVMFYCHHPFPCFFPEGNPKRCNIKRPVSSTQQLKVSINTLVKTLTSRQAHYVRCIKPNELKQPRIFEMALVQHQIRYLNLMETVQVWRLGFCYKLTYAQFLNRYKMLSLHTWPHWRGTPFEGVSYLVRSLPIPSAEFTFGRTKIFVRSPRTVFELEDFRRARLEMLAILIQKIWRGYYCRRRFLFLKKSQVVIANTWRSWKARRDYKLLRSKNQMLWAVRIIQRHYVQWKRRQFLLQLPQLLPSDYESPICREWPNCPPKFLEASILLRRIHHRWRCRKYRQKFDQTARNRMREKVTASIIFKDRKASYPRSVSHPFLGDYVRLRQNIQWKKICTETNDQYVVFADIINKITRSSGKFVPILLVVSTRSMLILDQRTLQVKYRVPATEIYRMSLSPYLDDVAVFHVRACPITNMSECSSGSTTPQPTGCLFQSDLSKKKGDFVFQTGHVIEIVTKLFLVVQNAVGKAPEVNISTEFEANFGQQTVIFTFKCMSLPEVQPGQIRVLRKGNKMEVLV